MASYTADAPRDRWKAIVAVLAVHVLLAGIIVTGLNVKMVAHVVERMKTFDFTEPPAPPRPPPPPAPKPAKAKQPEGAAAKRAEPTPVVAPPSERRSPIPAAKVAGQGNAAASGAASAGNGTGAGGSGTGRGADYSRFTPAQLVRNLTSADYRSIGAGRLPSGRAMVSLRVETSGVPSGCRIVRSSGDAAVDGGLCPLVEARLRFSPALDDQGRPIPYQLQYVARWRL
ncbi:MAG: hypothetical protein V4513_01865 [Pseudomonadota bacterium]